MAADRPQCTAMWEVEGRGIVRCTLPAGPHDDPLLGAYHQAPAEFPGGLTLWRDRATGATPCNFTREEPAMGRTFPEQIIDGNGDAWEPASGPGRNGEPVYYPTTGPETPAETPSEIEANYGRRR